MPTVSTLSALFVVDVCNKLVKIVIISNYKRVMEKSVDRQYNHFQESFGKTSQTINFHCSRANAKWCVDN